MQIVYIVRRLVYPFFSLFFLFAMVISGRADDAQPLGEVESNWPGVKLQLMQIRRVEGNRLLLVFRVMVTSSARNPTFIGYPPKAGWHEEKSLTPAQLISKDYVPTSFSLTQVGMVDEITHEKYTALPELPSSPFFGPNTVITTLHPGDWLQLSVGFPAPSLPTIQPGHPLPKQTVTFLFPNEKSSIKQIELPPALSSP